MHSRLPPLRRRRAALAASGSIILIIALLTLRPVTSELLAAERAFCVICGPHGGVDFILNIALFVPLGAALRLAGLARARAILLGVAVTVAIELLQLLIPGRITSLGDLIANSAGGALGVALADGWGTLVRPSPRAARRLTIAAAAAWLGVLGVTMWMFAPALPRSRWWGQIAAELGQFDHFTGEVLSARIGDIPVRDGEMENSDEVRRLLERDSTVVRTTIVLDGLTERLAPIVSIFDGRSREVMVLGQSVNDGIFRTRRHAAEFGLRQPIVNLFNALPVRTDGAARRDTITLEGWNVGWRQVIAADLPGRRVVRELTLRPTWGWALFLPFEHALGPTGRTFTRAWVALLLLPLGYYGAMAARRAPGEPGWRAAAAPFVALAVVPAGLELLPRMLGLEGARPWEVHGAILGCALGAVAALVILIGTSRRRREAP
jgi:hypothetical protein